MTKDLGALFKREAATCTPPDAATGDDELLGELSDEQLAELLQEMDAAFGPGVGARFLEYFSGPMPDEAWKMLQAIPDGFPATSQDFADSHETFRRLVGDKRRTRDQRD